MFTCRATQRPKRDCDSDCRRDETVIRTVDETVNETRDGTADDTSGPTMQLKSLQANEHTKLCYEASLAGLHSPVLA